MVSPARTSLAAEVMLSAPYRGTSWCAPPRRASLASITSISDSTSASSSWGVVRRLIRSYRSAVSASNSAPVRLRSLALRHAPPRPVGGDDEVADQRQLEAAAVDIATNILTSRLSRLVEYGVLTRKPYHGAPFGTSTA